LEELSESPLPGARYAHDVVGRRLAAVEAEAAALDTVRIREAVEALERWDHGYEEEVSVADGAFLDRAEVLALLRGAD
jgi:hypothetical protein